MTFKDPNPTWISIFFLKNVQWQLLQFILLFEFLQISVASKHQIHFLMTRRPSVLIFKLKAFQCLNPVKKPSSKIFWFSHVFFQTQKSASTYHKDAESCNGSMIPYENVLLLSNQCQSILADNILTAEEMLWPLKINQTCHLLELHLQVSNATWGHLVLEWAVEHVSGRVRLQSQGSLGRCVVRCQNNLYCQSVVRCGWSWQWDWTGLEWQAECCWY